MGDVILVPGNGAGQPSCLLALPPQVSRRTPLMISVHGVTRQPIEHLLAFAPIAAQAGAALLVPYFSETQHRRYQQLVHPRRGERADLALIEMATSVAGSHGLQCTRWHLFGYSGGAQFVHRFAMLHPQRVAALGIGAAGWYTLPDATLPYPQGLQGAEFLSGRALELSQFLRLPMRVWVGERDDAPDRHLREDPVIAERQGTHRIARARHWVAAIEAAAQERGFAADIAFALLPCAGHSFVRCVERGGLAQKVVSFFFGARSDDAGVSLQGAL